jgi:nucleoside-diphosphate-sugar epimerase
VVDWVAYDEDDILRDFEFFRNKTKRYVFISSTSVYSKPLLSPLVTETTPTGNRFWRYANNKAKCEQVLLSYYQTAAFPAVIVRPGHTYAEFALPTGFSGMGFGIVDRILRGKPVLVHGDGTNLWTLTYNEDFARAFIPLICCDSAVGEVFQITSDELLSWIQIYDLIGRTWGREVKYVFATSNLISSFDADLGASLLGDKAFSYLFVNTKLKKFVPSFSPRVKFEQGALCCRDWYRGHRQEVRVDPDRDLLMDTIIRYVETMEKTVREFG